MERQDGQGERAERQRLGAGALTLAYPQQLAYADLHRYVGDPRFVKVPVAGMLSTDYAKERSGLIDLDQANCSSQLGTPLGADPKLSATTPNPGTDTSYLTAADRDGNIVSLIQSLAGAFGSGVSVREYGIILQNRATGFTLRPGSPDVLAPHKRPFHTIIPAFMEKGDLHIGSASCAGRISLWPRPSLSPISSITK